jgi:hypothetical protein
MTTELTQILCFLEKKGAFSIPMLEIKNILKEFKNEDRIRHDTKGDDTKGDDIEIINKVILPYCGVINETTCQGIKNVHSLYIQCNKPRKDGEYCDACIKKNLGNIKDRGEEGWNIKGKKPTRYANVADKLGINLEEAKRYAHSIGVEIPPLELIKEIKRRGRPKKNKGTGETDVGDGGETKEDKKIKLSKQIEILAKEADEELTEEEIDDEIVEVDKSKLEKITLSNIDYFVYNDIRLDDKDQRVLLRLDLTTYGSYNIVTKKASVYDLD